MARTELTYIYIYKLNPLFGSEVLVPCFLVLSSYPKYAISGKVKRQISKEPGPHHMNRINDNNTKCKPTHIQYHSNHCSRKYKIWQRKN